MPLTPPDPPPALPVPLKSLGTSLGIIFLPFGTSTVSTVIPFVVGTATVGAVFLTIIGKSPSIVVYCVEIQYLNLLDVMT